MHAIAASGPTANAKTSKATSMVAIGVLTALKKGTDTDGSQNRQQCVQRRMPSRSGDHRVLQRRLGLQSKQS